MMDALARCAMARLALLLGGVSEAQQLRLQDLRQLRVPWLGGLADAEHRALRQARGGGRRAQRRSLSSARGAI